MSPCEVRFSFGSSGMLAQQIRHGAEFDLYLSANEQYVDELLRGGALDSDSKTRYAQGRIGLWSRKQTTFANLGSIRSLSLANPQHAPYGLAARQALESQGLWDQVKGNAVYAENVRQALRFATTGNADAAIVAWSLIKDNGGQLLPAAWHQPIIQTAGIPRRSRNPEAARRMLRFLLSPPGQQLLAQFGFSPAPPIVRTRPVSPAR
jgi:molybdate transport system substrate-binding protein